VARTVPEGVTMVRMSAVTGRTPFGRRELGAVGGSAATRTCGGGGRLASDELAGVAVPARVGRRRPR